MGSDNEEDAILRTVKLYMIDHVFDDDDLAKKKVRLQTLVAISFLSVVVVFYGICGFSPTSRVHHFPTSIYHAGITDPARYFSDIIVALLFLFAIKIRITYCYNVNKEQQALALFRALKEQMSAKSICLTEEELIRIKAKFEKTIRLCVIVKLVTQFTMIFSSAISVFMFGSTQTVPFLLLTWVIFVASTGILWETVIYPLGHLYIVSYYFETRINKLAFLANYMLSARRSQRFPFHLLNIYLRRHNRICADILKYATFWRSIYFFTLILVVPSNLFLVHCIFFGGLKWTHISAYISTAILTAVYIFAIGKFFASINYRIEQTKQPLLKLARIAVEHQRFRLWVKTMACLERMISPYMQVGFTCLTIFTVTYKTFFIVCICLKSKIFHFFIFISFSDYRPLCAILFAYS